MIDASTKHRVDYFDKDTKVVFVPSEPIQIYIAGDLNKAREICRFYCMEKGLCVNVIPNEYIYTGGSETGVRVEIINYPRFPKQPDELLYTAKELMYDLMFGLCQHSATVQTQVTTYWFSRRKEDVTSKVS